MNFQYKLTFQVVGGLFVFFLLFKNLFLYLFIIADKSL